LETFCYPLCYILQSLNLSLPSIAAKISVVLYLPTTISSPLICPSPYQYLTPPHQQTTSNLDAVEGEWLVYQKSFFTHFFPFLVQSNRKANFFASPAETISP
jgi:hypothetical protein